MHLIFFTFFFHFYVKYYVDVYFEYEINANYYYYYYSYHCRRLPATECPSACTGSSVVVPLAAAAVRPLLRTLTRGQHTTSVGGRPAARWAARKLAATSDVGATSGTCDVGANRQQLASATW